MKEIAGDAGGNASASGQTPLPNAAVFFVGSGAVALLSLLFLPWPAAPASIILGTLMVAGADNDARTFVLPDTITLGATISGIIVAMVLDRTGSLQAGLDAFVRAVGTATALALVRSGYARLRKREGIGLGDVKLAAAAGAWLPIEAVALCFSLAAGAALTAVTARRARGQPIDPTTRIPFGAFLCPALWLMFFVTALPACGNIAATLCYNL